ncbi:MAG: hypothetical protein ACMXX6_01950 [Candidatus Woesearchaeota archaeon]
MSTLIDFLNHNDLTRVLRRKSIFKIEDVADDSNNAHEYRSNKINVVNKKNKDLYDFYEQMFCGDSEYRHYVTVNEEFENCNRAVYIVADNILIGQVKIGYEGLESSSFLSFNRVLTKNHSLEFGCFYEVERSVRSKVFDVWNSKKDYPKILRVDNINLNFRRKAKEETFFLLNKNSLRESIRAKRNYIEKII